MDSWDSPCDSRSFRQRCRHALGNFFHSFQKDQPRWISISKPVAGDEKNWINYLLGFDQKTAVQFLISTGLIKEGHSRNPSAIVVVTAEWDKFILEEGLEDLMESVNKTKLHYFINIGAKSMLRHRPIDQFSEKFELKEFAGYLSARQRRLHKELSEVLISLHPKISKLHKELSEVLKS